MKLKRAVPVLAAGLALSVGAAACGSSENKTTDAQKTSTPASTTTTAAETQAAQAGNIKIAFSAPAADHGWLGAVIKDAKAEAKSLGINMDVQDSAATTADQADQITTLTQ